MGGAEVEPDERELPLDDRADLNQLEPDRLAGALRELVFLVTLFPAVIIMIKAEFRHDRRGKGSLVRCRASAVTSTPR
jgi:hypothetical protein